MPFAWGKKYEGVKENGAQTRKGKIGWNKVQISRASDPKQEPDSTSETERRAYGFVVRETRSGAGNAPRSKEVAKKQTGAPNPTAAARTKRRGAAAGSSGGRSRNRGRRRDGVRGGRNELKAQQERGRPKPREAFSLLDLAPALKNLVDPQKIKPKRVLHQGHVLSKPQTKPNRDGKQNAKLPGPRTADKQSKKKIAKKDPSAKKEEGKSKSELDDEESKKKKRKPTKMYVQHLVYKPCKRSFSLQEEDHPERASRTYGSRHC